MLYSMVGPMEKNLKGKNYSRDILPSICCKY